MWSGTAFRWKGPRVRVGDSERDLKALGGCLRPAGAAVNPVSLPLLQRLGGSVGGRRLLWERGVRLWRDPQKGFCARETWQMSLSTFLNHHFKPELSQLQNGAGSPSLWLLESISTKLQDAAQEKAVPEMTVLILRPWRVLTSSALGQMYGKL